MLPQQLLNALTLGSVYALFALGFTLMFGVLGVINLSHGAVFMVGSYAALFVVTHFHLPLWLALLSAMAFSGTLGLLIDVLILKPLRARNAPHLIPMIATIGVAITLSSAAQGSSARRSCVSPKARSPRASSPWAMCTYAPSRSGSWPSPSR